MIASLPSSVPKAMRVPSGRRARMLVRTRWEFQRLDAALPVDQREIRLSRRRRDRAGTYTSEPVLEKANGPRRWHSRPLA